MTDVSALKRRVPTKDLVIYIDGKILNRFESFNITQSIDIVPFTFEIQYAFSGGESSNSPLDIVTKLTKEDDDARGLLKAGQKVEIYLEKEPVLTGYITSVAEAYSHERHVLYVDGRSRTSVLVDASTDRPAGMIPDSVISLSDAADFFFKGFGIHTDDRTGGDTPRPIAGFAQYTITDKPYEIMAGLAQYEGKLLYDHGQGQMVISDVAKPTNGKAISDTTHKFESVVKHSTTLGRYRKYTSLLNSYGGPAGIDKSQIIVPSSQDPYPDELPPGQNMTIVSQAAWPSDGNTNGLADLQKARVDFLARKNWGRGQTVSVTSAGFINPSTGKIWKINSSVKLNLTKPLINDEYIVQAINFRIDRNEGSNTDLVLVKREALTIEPIAINPSFAGTNISPVVNTEDSSNDGSLKSQTDKNNNLNIKDNPPSNAKGT